MSATGIARKMRSAAFQREYSGARGPISRSTGYDTSGLPLNGGYSSVSRWA